MSNRSQRLSVDRISPRRTNFKLSREYIVYDRLALYPTDRAKIVIT